MPKKFFNLFRRKKQKRGFSAAAINRLVNDWATISKSIDEDLKNGVLSVLRARSRDLCTNNDYGRKFLTLVTTNVVGPNGIKLQSKVYRPANSRGKMVLDGPANEQIERAWRKWCNRKHCCVDKQLSFADVQTMAIKSIARDGEALIRIVRGFNNDFAFALQVLDPARLDEKKNDKDKRISLGVQKNEWGEPIKYYLLPDSSLNSIYESVGIEHEVVDASEIIHVYIRERAGQSRGYPWTTTALKRLYMLGQYEESEMVAARIAAAKMGFIISPSGNEYQGDDTDTQGNIIMDVSPGKFEQLPRGWDIKPFDVDHPNSAFEDFVKACLRGAAAGLGISYPSLSSDISDATYSSTRHAVLEERDFWVTLQRWFIDNFCQPIFDAWLPAAIVSGQLKLPARYLDRWNSPVWQGRRWSWIDPLKDMRASAQAIKIGINSRTRIASEQGHDFDDIIEELAREKEKAENLGLTIEEVEKGTKEEKNAISRIHTAISKRTRLTGS